MPLNWPNLLTWLRILMIPVFLVVFYFPDTWLSGPQKNLTATALFGLASLTDWLDGYLARRRKQVTAFGQVIDPLADKLLISAALISLVQLELAAAWMVAVIIGREFAVTGLRSLAYARGLVIPASSLGKIKMIAEVVAILALILSRTGNGDMAELYLVGQAALWVVLAAALVSAADYFRRFNVVLSPRVTDITVAREQRSDRKAG